MAMTEVTVADMALSRIGVSREISPDVDGTLANSTDASVEKRICETWYPRKRNALLEAFPWTFARKFVTLVLADDGTGEIWVDEWENAYTYPADCLKIRRFVNDVGLGYYEQGYDARLALREDYSANPWPYVIRQHAAAKVILTDVATADADIEYTMLVTDASLFPEMFASCLAWSLAAEIAIPLAVDDRFRQRALQMYRLEYEAATAYSANEEQPHQEGDGSFVRARGGD